MLKNKLEIFMKQIMILFIISTLLSAGNFKIFADKMTYETNFAVALQKAKKDIFLIVVTNSCHWCAKYESKTLSQQDMDKRIKEKFIPLIMNRDSKDFLKKYYLPIVPITYIINHKTQEEENSMVGYRTTKELSDEIDMY